MRFRVDLRASRPFSGLVNETLAFLKRQKIPQKLIEIWLAPGHAPGVAHLMLASIAAGQKLSERERYEKVLAAEWPDVHIRTGVKGVMQQRHVSIRLLKALK